MRQEIGHVITGSRMFYFIYAMQKIEKVFMRNFESLSYALPEIVSYSELTRDCLQQKNVSICLNAYVLSSFSFLDKLSLAIMSIISVFSK